MHRSAEGRREPRRRTPRNELAGLAGPALLAREPDERLLALVREGDQNAFTAIVERYAPALEVHCRRMLAPARAEDAVQQTFASAYAAIVRGATPAALRPWLYTIAHNTSLNGLRERQPERLEFEPELGDQHLPHEIVARRESLQGLVLAIRGLPMRQREVIVRQEFHGASHEQIAAELGMTTGAVRQLAHRARSAIRAAVGGLMPPPLWQRLQCLWAPSEGGALVGGSAGGFGLVVSKSAIAVLVAGAAGGAVELTSTLGTAGTSPVAHASPAGKSVAVRPVAGTRGTERDVVAIVPAGTRQRAPAEPRDAAPSDSRGQLPAGASTGTDAPVSHESDAADAQPSDEHPVPRAAAGDGDDAANGGDGAPPSPAGADTDVAAAPEGAPAAQPDAAEAAPSDAGQSTSPAAADTEVAPAADAPAQPDAADTGNAATAEPAQAD